MKKHHLMLTLAVLAALAAPLAWAEEMTLDAVEQAVVGQWDKLTSLSGTLSGTADVKLKPDQPQPMKFVLWGGLDYVKKEGVSPARVELAAGVAQPNPMARALFDCDGTNAYVEWKLLMNVDWEQVPTTSVPSGGAALFSLMKEHLNLAVKPEAKVGDKDAYVLEGTPKNAGDDIPVSKALIYFGKDSGVLLKAEVFDKSDVQMATLNVENLKFNEPIDAARFTYTPPPPKPEPPAATPAEEAPKEEAKPAEEKK